jgi:hypothetical protein
MTTQRERDRAESLEAIRPDLPPGATIHTILRHVSASGMTRDIEPMLLTRDHGRYIGWHVGRILDLRNARTQDNSVRISGCGMDMGFHLVYELGRALYPDGYTCPGPTCHSNDHTNGDRDRTPHHHRDGGYALRQEWL